MNDLISRQSAIDAVRKEYEGIHNANIDGDFLADEVEFIITKVPAVQVRKKGWWIHKVRRFATHWSCSVCGNMWFFDCSTWAFCPKCGAKMEGTEEK